LAESSLASERRRKMAERAFHDARFGGVSDARADLDKWYAAVAEGARLQGATIQRLACGGRVLELGCADGDLSVGRRGFAREAAHFVGIDISCIAVTRARSRAWLHGLTACDFQVMDAERLAFRDGSFDLVFGRGILHHLDLAPALAQISRVLRPGGVAIFYEPMGVNPAINLFRRRTPHLRTRDERPLSMADIALAQATFRRVEARYYGLTTLLAVPLRTTPVGRPIMALCARADRLLLSLPPIRRHAWHVLLTLIK
jgi:SAM-dependent methyltransferase